MPVRSLNSSVLKWPDQATVDSAVRFWASHVAERRSDIVRVGYFGSYARGDWGVGSDLDLLIVVESSTLPFERRSAEWDTTWLPVPVDVLVYTRDEWQASEQEKGFPASMAGEIVWVYVKGVGHGERAEQ